MSYVIQTRQEALPTFYSLRAGRDFGSPHGWTGEREQALQFARRLDAENFVATFLMHQASFCTILPLEERT